MTDGEYVYFNAVRSALNYDELKSTEAVIRAIKWAIPYLGDEALEAMLERVSAYVEEGKSGVFDAHFIPEWADVRALMTEEKRVREKVRRISGRGK